MAVGCALAVELGAVHTVAMLGHPDGRVEPLLFDSSPLLPSAVFAQPDGSLLAGRDAVHAARLAPERYEPNPLLHITGETVPLGDDVPVVTALAAVLGRVAAEAARVGGAAPGAVVLLCPAGWAEPERSVLTAAAESAGLGTVLLEAAPIAAARYFHRLFGAQAAPLTVLDLGGTAEVSVVFGDRVLATERLAEAGGLDLDEALIDHLDGSYREQDPAGWQRLRAPETPDERRARQQLLDDVRAAKEMLSRNPQASVHVPLVGVDAPISRAELAGIAEPMVGDAVEALRAALRSAGLALPLPGPMFLVGGMSRMPLVATVLHRELGVAPTGVNQPELVGVHGALLGLLARPAPVGGAADPRRARADQAYRLLAQAEQLARRVSAPADRAPALAHLAAAMASVAPDRARQLAIEADAVARGTHDVRFRAGALGEVLAGLAAVELPELAPMGSAAARTALAVPDPYWQVMALADLATALRSVLPARAAALIEVAELLVEGIADQQQRRDGLLSVGQAAALVDPARAVRLAGYLDDPDARASMLASAAVTVAAADPDRGAELAAEALRCARTQATPNTWVSVLTYQVLSGGPRGEAATVEEAVRIAYGCGDPVDRAWLLACCAVLTDDAGRAERLAADATAQTRFDDTDPAVAAGIAAAARLLAGPLPVAAEVLGTACARMVAATAKGRSSEWHLAAVATVLADLVRLLLGGPLRPADMWS